MRLSRRRSEGEEVHGEALLGLDGSPLRGDLVGAVNWSGPKNLIAYLPGSFLDKGLSNIAAAGDQISGFALLDDIDSFLLETETEMGLLQHQVVTELPLARRVVMDASVEVVGDARVTTVVHVFHDRRLLGAETWFEPIELTLPIVMEAAFWAYWDWTCMTLAELDSLEVVACLFQQLNWQAALARHALEHEELELGRIPYWIAFEHDKGLPL